MMKVSDAVAKYLASQGITTIFGYQGGAITHLIDSFDREGIRYIQTYHEQGASLAADAYSRVSEQGIGVAIATNGPGATNMVTGIANAYCDSVPVLYLTGQVHTFAMKKDARIRQESFQEIDILSIVKSITKYAVTVMDKDQVLPELQKAIQIAKSGRPGPVLVDLPVDVQGDQIDYSELDEVIPEDNPNDKYELDLWKMKFEKPLIIAGGGIRTGHAVREFREFVEKTRIPVVTSLMGLDAMDHRNPDYIGFIGSYGNRYANLAVQNADLILVLGSRLDMRQTGKRRDLFAPNAKIVHVDIDKAELGHFVLEEKSIQSDILTFLKKEIQNVPENVPNWNEWKSQINAWKQKYSDTMELDSAGMNPNAILKQMGQWMNPETIACSDVGQNQMWLAQSFRGSDLRILNSGGLGAMGYSLPAAIGAAFAKKDAATVVAFMGDGGLQMNIQELQVVGAYQLPIITVVWNNHALGLIRDVHEKYYNCRYVGSVDGFSLPDLSSLAVAYRLGYVKVTSMDELSQVEPILRDHRPYLVEIEIMENTYVRPELLGQDGLDHQFPYKELTEA